MGLLTAPLTYVMIAIMAIGASIYSIQLPREFGDLTQAPTVNGDNCHKLNNIGSVADLVVDETTTLVYVSSGKNKHRNEYYPPFGLHNRGLRSVYYHDYVALYNPSTEKFKILEFENFEGHDFIGQGIAITRAQEAGDNSNFLYFVNHKRSGPVISVFKHKKGTSTLQYLHEFKSPSFIYTPSAVAPISPFEVYITNDHYFTRGPGRLLENALSPLASGNVVHCIFDPKSKETSCNKVVTGLAMPNGLEYLPARNELVVGESMTGHVTFFPRVPDSQTGDVDASQKRVTDIGAPLSNIRRVPGRNDLIVSVLPDLGRTSKVLANVTHDLPVPGMAVFLREVSNYEQPVLAYHGKGEQLSFMSGYSMLPSKRQLLGGSALNDGILVCDLDYSLFGM